MKPYSVTSIAARKSTDWYRYFLWTVCTDTHPKLLQKYISMYMFHSFLLYTSISTMTPLMKFLLNLDWFSASALSQSSSEIILLDWWRCWWRRWRWWRVEHGSWVRAGVPEVYTHVRRWGLGVGRRVTTALKGQSVRVRSVVHDRRVVHEVLLKVWIGVEVGVEAAVVLLMSRSATLRVPVLPGFSPWGRWRSAGRGFTVCWDNHVWIMCRNCYIQSSNSDEESRVYEV